MGILADRESRLLIDGELVAGSGGTFQTINPATEEVLGVAADASTDDMGRAIEAARRAFDETGWSTDTELRVRGVEGLWVMDAAVMARVPSANTHLAVIALAERLAAAFAT